ncbi:MAG: hypothetical protein RJA37_1156 [Verrucomicrobiota bacterium]
MPGLRQFSIALRWALCLSLTPLFGQGRSDLRLPQLGKEESAKVLSDLRNSRLTADVCFRFEAVHRPRRGEESAPVKGTLWAGSRGLTHYLRIEMEDAASTRILASKSETGSEVHVHADGKAGKVAPGTFTPLSPGLLISAFDLQLPFTHWPDTRYASTERGVRPMHVYRARQAGIDGEVEFGIDHSFGAVLQVQVKSGDGKSVRMLAVEDFAKAGEQWVLGACSVRDEASRDMDVLRFTEAALGLAHDPSRFDEATLSRPAVRPTTFQPL